MLGSTGPLKAKRLRVWSLVIANRVAESIVGALRIEDARAARTAHAVMGGVFLTWAAERVAAVRREVELGVDAYNRVGFLRLPVTGHSSNPSLLITGAMGSHGHIQRTTNDCVHGRSNEMQSQPSP